MTSPNPDSWDLPTLLADESLRQREFPITREKIFLAHAAVTALPRCAADAVIDYTEASAVNHQEFGDVLDQIKATRRVAAEAIGARPSEVALLGPTSLGLSLFAHGLPWKAGDEIVCYQDDYPANVYPWLDLERAHGVKLRYLKPEQPGHLTPELVAAALTSRTRLVALASCHFLTGFRIDHDAIGRMLHDRGILFSLDGIQTIGAFPTNVDHVDFLSADAHKWMLGPLAMGIVYVAEEHFELLRPALLGAWNVRSPNFITQDTIEFVPTAQRYEPGVLNITGALGMKAALEMFLRLGPEAVAGRLLTLKKHLVAGLLERRCEIVGPTGGPNASSITTFRRDGLDLTALFDHLTAHGVVSTLRFDRAGAAFLRLSPHFYNTEAEIDRVLDLLDAAP